MTATERTLTAKHAEDKRWLKAWTDVFAATHRLRAMFVKDGATLEVAFKVKGPRKAKEKRRGK
jgi:hypothetical protein